jgi:RimJ/RimL family protein N-acetyltransferase
MPDGPGGLSSNDRGYLFRSERLGFRNWIETDIAIMAGISADPDVMAFFPAVATLAQTTAFIERMQKEFEEKGYCYFAVDKLETSELIGFIGLSERTFEAAFTPCVDIGWRLAKSQWNNGYATEGAKRCLAYAFDTLNLESVYAMAPRINVKSEIIMQKAGMKKAGEFEHVLLQDYPRLKDCVLYQMTIDAR